MLNSCILARNLEHVQTFIPLEGSVSKLDMFWEFLTFFQKKRKTVPYINYIAFYVFIYTTWVQIIKLQVLNFGPYRLSFS